MSKSENPIISAPAPCDERPVDDAGVCGSVSCHDYDHGGGKIAEKSDGGDDVGVTPILIRNLTKGLITR